MGTRNFTVLSDELDARPGVAALRARARADLDREIADYERAAASTAACASSTEEQRPVTG